MRTISVLTLLAAMSVFAQAQAFNNDCALSFKGSFRKAIKNRRVSDGTSYTIHNNGQPITVDEWFGLVCSFDPQLKGKSVTTSTPVLDGFETVKVTLEGFLWERGLSATSSKGMAKTMIFTLK